MTQKTQKLSRDLKYGYKLKDIDKKVTKELYGTLVNKIKQAPAKTEQSCGFCRSHTL